MVKNPLANAGDTGETGFDFWSGRSPRVGNGNPLLYSPRKYYEQSRAGYISWGQRVGHDWLSTHELLNALRSKFWKVRSTPVSLHDISMSCTKNAEWVEIWKICFSSFCSGGSCHTFVLLISCFSRKLIFLIVNNSISDSLCCTASNNTTLGNNYTPIIK